MNKHNNNSAPCSSRRCKCGRYMTIGEFYGGVGLFSYLCPDCQYLKNLGINTIAKYNEYLKKART